MSIEKLFSYGTLRYEAVQFENFGRKLTGRNDSLPKFKRSEIKITDPEVIAISGEHTHSIIAYTGKDSDSIDGIVFDISPEELNRADSYEVSDYERIQVQLNSGVHAWVYASATDPNRTQSTEA
ncbi:MAG: gamma-glutamylcyclotransferase [Gammaproteobacteria bacterium]|nr:gamma-glutamylcyclotransferase [Gammaproteobacteria bacterium]